MLRFDMNAPASSVPVVLLDDHAAVLRQIQAILPPEFQVVAALTDSIELIRILKIHSPQIVVMDITLPGLNGIELATLIRQTNHACKIVFLTVHEDSDYIHAAFAAGADGYVVKSHLAGDLVPALHAVLADRKYGAPVHEPLADTA